jgi:hypothetical protein
MLRASPGPITGIPGHVEQTLEVQGPAPVEDHSTGRPLLPDGTTFDCEPEYWEEADRTLRNLMEDIQTRRKSQTPVIRLLIGMHVSVARNEKLARDEETKHPPNYPAAAKLRTEAQRITKEIMALYKQMGLVGQDTSKTPMQYVEELRRRVKPFIEKHGLERAYACQRCGSIQMVYALMKIEVSVDWATVRQILLKRGVPEDLVIQLTQALIEIPLPTLGTLVHTPFTHPFLQHPDYPIWSSVLQRMLHEKCDCGRPKLTFPEAAEILQISPDGVDQMLQEAEKDAGRPPIEGWLGTSAASVFSLKEGEEGDSGNGSPSPG